MKKIRTGYFGGSFNPIHVGHIRLAEYIVNKKLVDEIWFVVSPQNPLKPTADPADARNRLEQTRKALLPYPKLKSSDFEFNLPIPSFTCFSLQEAIRLYPDREFTLVIGGDNLVVFNQWKDYSYLLDHFDILVYPRPGFNPVIPADWKRVTLIDAPLMDISSTHIRENNQPINR
jgi:nicotinate-nucleotide adenylyltransferase